MPIRVAGTLEEYFPDPEKFKPERWSRKNKNTPNVFGSLPFGFGIRMCVGVFKMVGDIVSSEINMQLM